MTSQDLQVRIACSACNLRFLGVSLFIPLCDAISWNENNSGGLRWDNSQKTCIVLGDVLSSSKLETTPLP